MWLCTRLGFFSVVRKAAVVGTAPFEYHIRARVRRDLELLSGVARKRAVHLPPIEEWPGADYRYRIRTNVHGWHAVMTILAQSVGYPNFKTEIASNPEQRDKLPAYHDLWHAGRDWKLDRLPIVPRQEIQSLTCTSADDLRSSLTHYDAASLPVLRAALEECERGGMKTKAAHLQRRINQLTRSAGGKR